MKIGEVKPYHWAIAAIALLLLIVPIVGTVYPAPAYPLNLFAYIYGGYIVVGIVLVFVRSRTSIEFESIRKVLEEKTAVVAASEPAIDTEIGGEPAMA
jgi:hypothetical protein